MCMSVCGGVGSSQRMKDTENFFLPTFFYSYRNSTLIFGKNQPIMPSDTEDVSLKAIISLMQQAGLESKPKPLKEAEKKDGEWATCK